MSTLSKHMVETQLMIRRPALQVFNAFEDPEITKKFWFTRSTGRLEEGKTVTWYWDMYGVSTQVNVQKIIPGKLIRTKWDDPQTTVDYEFMDLGNDCTYVVIRNYGFTQEGDELIQLIKDNTGGFTSVLDGLKAWLEHGIELRLVEDKFPQRKNDQPQSLNDWQKGT